jgi:hypothetical protein
MAQFKLYVDNIVDYENNGTYGIAKSDDYVRRDFDMIFTKPDADDLIDKADKEEKGISLMHSFCQFIVYLNLHKDFKGSQIVFMDCRNDIDTALDIYNAFTKNNWGAATKNEFMKQFTAIQDKYEIMKDVAELVTE